MGNPLDELSGSQQQPLASNAQSPGSPFGDHSSPKFGVGPQPPVSGPQDASSAPHFGSASPEPIQFKDAVMGITLERSSVTKPVPGYTGLDWSEDQWIRKALEIAEGFMAEEEGWGLRTNLSDPPGARPDSPKQPPSPKTPPAVSRGFLKSGAGGAELPLIASAEDSGLDVIPDWYLALDRIYETTNMVAFCTPPIPVCADKSIIDSPGHSYAIGKKTTITPARHNYTAPPRPPAAAARPFGAATAPAAHTVASTGRAPTPTRRAPAPKRRP